MNKKVLFTALEKTIFYMACVHLLLILTQAVRTGDYTFINMAAILDLDFFFPIAFTLTTAVLTVLPIILLFLFLVWREKRLDDR